MDLDFSFDIVIVKFNLTNFNAKEKSKLIINIKFIDNKNIKVTPSRINVSEFKRGRSCEFKEHPEILKDALYKNPLECHVYYDEELAGVCTFNWPEPFINLIAEGNGCELIHCDKADIYMNDQTVGQIEILSRLQIKPQEFDEMPKCYSARKAIKRNDIMFVVGENKTGSIKYCDVDLIIDSESVNTASLDLSDFQHLHGKTIPNIAILESIETKRYKIKESSNQCKQIIKNLLAKAKEASTALRNTIEQQQKHCIFESGIASFGSADSYPPIRCTSDENIYHGLNTNCEKVAFTKTLQ